MEIFKTQEWGMRVHFFLNVSVGTKQTALSQKTNYFNVC